MTQGLQAKVQRRRKQLARIPGVLADNDRLANEVIHPYLLRHARLQFESSGAHGGRPWDPYTGEPRYRAMILAARGDLRVLRGRPGDEPLMESFVNPSHPNHRFSVDQGAVRFGSSLPFVGRIESGGQNQYGEVARPRPIMTMTDAQRDELSRLVGLYKQAQVEAVMP